MKVRELRTYFEKNDLIDRVEYVLEFGKKKLTLYVQSCLEKLLGEILM